MRPSLVCVLIFSALFVAAVSATPNDPSERPHIGSVERTPNAPPHVVGRAASDSSIHPFNADPSKCRSRFLSRMKSASLVERSPSLGAGHHQVVDNGVVRVGVHGGGNLNSYPTPFSGADSPHYFVTNPVGIRYHINTANENDATSPGCLCEGFGASAVFTDSSSVQGGANQASGENNIAYPDPSLVGSNGVDSSATIGTTLGVTHSYRPSNQTLNGYEILVTLKNLHTSASITRLRYERSMDWDIYPSTFWECVDVDLGTAADVPCAHNDGFVQDFPNTDFTSSSGLSGAAGQAGSCFGSPRPRSFSNVGPADQGSAFLIQFSDITSSTPLAPGGSRSFSMFYGAANNKAAARAVLGAIGAEAFSLGYPSRPDRIASYASRGYVGTGTCGPTNDGSPNTYIWAFKNVGGTVIIPNTDCGGDCAHKSACPTTFSASAGSTSKKCASISFDEIPCTP